MSTFVDRLTWRELWKICREIPGGSQAQSFEARSINPGPSVFLKVLRDQKSMERRSRFHREAVAYDSLSHTGLPKLIETNAHHHGDDNYNLYIVCEFITGPRISDVVNQPMGIDRAKAFMTPFLDTLNYLHANGTVHRDIKPDNLLLRDGNLTKPVLVDFGLTFGIDDVGHQTEIGQEIGNRFLKLPELLAGSLAKQDPASDVALAAGLFFFLITGQHPRSLLDERGRLPHQRVNVADLFDRKSKIHRRLLRIFDIAFAYRVDDRLQTTGELSLLIEKLEEETTDDDFDAKIQAFEAELNTPELQMEEKRRENLSVVMNCASDANQRVGNRLKVRYLPSQSDYERSGNTIRNKLGIVDKDNRERSFYNQISAQLIGDEIVVTLNDETAMRFKWNSFDPSEVQGNFEREFLLTAMAFHEDH